MQTRREATTYTNTKMILEILLVLFIPGYALMWAFFPGKEEIDLLERIALSFALSISVVVLSIQLLGIAINLINFIMVILAITITGFIVGYYRKKKIIT